MSYKDDLTFRKMRGLKMAYKKQGLIYFTCLNIKLQDDYTKQKVKDLCERVGGIAYAHMLYEQMTCEQTVRKTAQRYFTSERNLYRLRRRFFELWFEYDKEKRESN